MNEFSCRKCSPFSTCPSHAMPCPKYKLIDSRKMTAACRRSLGAAQLPSSPQIHPGASCHFSGTALRHRRASLRRTDRSISQKAAAASSTASSCNARFAYLAPLLSWLFWSLARHLAWRRGGGFRIFGGPPTANGDLDAPAGAAGDGREAHQDLWEDDS